MKKRYTLMLMIIGIISLVLITLGVTYAFYNYTKEGTTDNTITTSTITFLYTEIDKVGAGISINDAYPISDTQGKMLSGTNEVFDFKITSTTPNTSSIPYEITARKNSNSTLDEDAVKLYLTKVVGTTEEEVLLSKYSDLTQTSKVSKDKYTEKTIYTGKVPADSSNFEQAFKLRMWIASDVEFSPLEDGSYPYNDKEFTVNINVYADTKVVTEEEVLIENNTKISTLSMNGEELNLINGKDYDYDVTLSSNETSASFDIETENPNATVEIEKLDSLAYGSNIKRMNYSETFELTSGNNYFKVTVTSQNKEKIDEYIIRVRLFDTMDLNYSLIIGQEVKALDNSRWYVLEDSESGNEYVTLISKYNVNSSSKQSSSCDVNSTTKSCGFIFDKDNSNIYDESNENNIAYFIKNTYEPIISDIFSGTVSVTLPTADQITKADGKVFKQTTISLESEWLLYSNYWLKDPVNNSKTDVFVVSGFYREIQRINAYRDRYDVGFRPVIKTLKTNLLAENSNATVRSISINDEKLELITDGEYDYELNFPSDVKNVVLNIDTLNPYTKINIDSLDDSFEYSSNMVLELNAGDNIYNMTVTSEDGKVTKKYTLKIFVEYEYKMGKLLTMNDGSRWYVLENSGLYEENITLISRYNINSSGKQSSSCDVYSSTSTCGFAFDTKNSNKYDETNSNNIGYFVKNTFEPLVVSALPGTTNVTIPTAEQIAALNGVEFNNSAFSIGLSWINHSNFWLKTPVINSSTNIWAVSGYSSVTVKVAAKRTTYDVGIRAVITTPKTNIKT